MLDSFNKGERVSAKKLNTYRRQTLRNVCHDAGTISPQGHSSGKTKSRVYVPDDPEPESNWVFGMDYTSAEATIYTGFIYFDGAWRECTGETITLSGNPCFIYASMNRISYAVTLKTANSRPGHTPEDYNLLLAEFSASGPVYSLVRRYHKGAKDADHPTP